MISEIIKEDIKHKTYIQRNLFGGNVHILNTKEIYRLVKCSRCQRTVKLSQAKTHISFGNALTVCYDCLGKKDKRRSNRNN